MARIIKRVFPELSSYNNLASWKRKETKNTLEYYKNVIYYNVSEK